MAEYLNVLESLNELGTVARLPTLINIFDKLLDSEAPVLTRRCWRTINVRSRLPAKSPTGETSPRSLGQSQPDELLFVAS